MKKTELVSDNVLFPAVFSLGALGVSISMFVMAENNERMFLYIFGDSFLAYLGSSFVGFIYASVMYFMFIMAFIIPFIPTAMRAY